MLNKYFPEIPRTIDPRRTTKSSFAFVLVPISMKRNQGQVAALNADVQSFMPALTAARLSSGHIDVHRPPSANYDFEPTRALLDSAPPKRFYRTIWRSWARQIMDSDIASKGGVMKE
jgi:hypothetical protein